MKLYDKFNAPHTVTYRIEYSRNGYDEPIKVARIMIDGESVLFISAAPNSHIHQAQIERSAQRFLDGLHHPTHYRGKFSHLA